MSPLSSLRCTQGTLLPPTAPVYQPILSSRGSKGATQDFHRQRICCQSIIVGPGRWGPHRQHPKSLKNLTSAEKAILPVAWCEDQLKYAPKQRRELRGWGGGALPLVVTRAGCCTVGLNNPAPHAALSAWSHARENSETSRGRS